MPDVRWLLLLVSAALLLVLARALITGNIHSQYSVTHRNQNPGTFWALWVVHWGGRVILHAIPIRAPLPCVSMHVVEPEAIGAE